MARQKPLSEGLCSGWGPITAFPRGDHPLQTMTPKGCCDRANLLLALPPPWDVKAEMSIELEHSEAEHPELAPLK